MYARLAVLFAVIAIIALVLAVIGLALSGDGDDSDEEDSVDGALVACSALDELDSYRYTVAVQIADPATPTEPPEGETPAPLSALGEALADLLSDFTLEGAYVQPDRSQAVLTFSGEEIELRVIGDQSWVRVGDEWGEEEASSGDLLTPTLVCNEVVQAVSPSLTEAEEPDGEVNGAATTEYTLDPAKTQNLPPLLGQELEGPYTIGLWVTKEERYPARLVILSEGPDGDEPAFELRMEVFDANSDGIAVEAPE